MEFMRDHESLFADLSQNILDESISEIAAQKIEDALGFDDLMPGIGELEMFWRNKNSVTNLETVENAVKNLQYRFSRR